MYRLFTSIAILGVAFSIFGCAGIPKQKFIFEEKLAPDSVQAIKTIALLDVPNPPHYYLGGGIGPATFFFGFLGAAAELSSVGKDTKEYGDFNFSAIAEKRLIEHLTTKGYKVFMSNVSRKNQHELINDYQSLKIAGADAFLDVVPVEVGFKRNAWAGPFASEVGPHVSLVVKFVSADSKKILYAESAQYGYDKNPFTSGIKINSPKDHKFKSVDDLKENKQEAIEQLIEGIDVISQAVAEKLAR